MWKKLFILGLLVFAGSFLYLKLHSRNIPVALEDLEVSNPKIEKYKDVLRSKIPQDLTEKWTNNWAKLKDAKDKSSQKVKAEISDVKDALEFSQFVLQVARRTKDCLQEDFCGFRPATEGAYFDPENTPAHIALERSLTWLERLKDQVDVTQLMPFDELMSYLKIKSERVQKSVLNLATKYPDRDKILLSARDLEGQASAEFYKLMAKSLPEEMKPALMSEAIHDLQTKDMATVIAILESAKDLPPNENSFAAMVSSLCHFKSEAGNEHNWLAIKKNLDEIRDKNSFQTQPGSLCR